MSDFEDKDQSPENEEPSFERKHLPAEPIDIAPDGSEVRPLLRTDKASMAHFELGPKQTSIAVKHKTVSEFWYFLGGRGQMWLKDEKKEKIVDVYANVSVSIPVGTHFQFRSFGFEPLSAVGTTIPPWPLEEGVVEAVEVDGKWSPTVDSGDE